MRFRTLSCLIMSLVSVILYGHDLPTILNDDPELRLKQKIEDFQMYLNMITSKKYSVEVIETAVNECLNLFIGKGECYRFDDAYGFEIKEDPVAVHLITKRGKRQHILSVKKFLTDLANVNSVYSRFEVFCANYLVVDRILSSLDNGYRCLADLYTWVHYQHTEKAFSSNWEICQKKSKFL